MRFLLNLALFALTLGVWRFVLLHSFTPAESAAIIVVGVVLIVPVSWLARRFLDRNPTPARCAWTTTAVHYTVMMLLGSAVVEAVETNVGWRGWRIPVPPEVGLGLLWVTGLFALATVLNLALSGLGAPFAVALSRRLAVGAFYAWTRNPMGLGTMAFLVALGLYFGSSLFVVWVVLLFSPAWLAFVRLYEERELEIRFGDAYRAYRANTPLLFPRKPKRPLPAGA